MTPTAPLAPNKSKQERSVSLLQALDTAGTNGIIAITQGRKTDVYFLDRMESDFGAAYLLDKYSGADEDTPYHVCLDGRQSSCECKGFLRHHHCRHVEALTALKEAGLLPPTPAGSAIAA